MQLYMQALVHQTIECAKAHVNKSVKAFNSFSNAISLSHLRFLINWASLRVIYLIAKVKENLQIIGK